jgi:hypothetical protein
LRGQIVRSGSHQDDGHSTPTEPPLHVTSVSILQSGTAGADHHASGSVTTVLLTTNADATRRDRGHGFWADVINNDGQLLIADFGAVQ